MSPTAAEAFAQPRPRIHGLDATTTLQDFAIVTFDVEPARLASVLPIGLVPEVRTMDDSRERGFVSAVSFRDVDFRFAFAGWLRRSFFQTNYRAYVRDADGQQAVFFFGTTLDSRLVAVPRLVWGMPWHPGRTSIEAEWMDDVCTGYRHRCDGAWGGADVALIGSAESAGRLDGFADADDAAHVLTHPLDGWFRRPDGRLGGYTVWHERMKMTVGRAVRARYDVFDEIGLVVPGATPHSVLLIPSVEFDVLLPPT